MRNKMGGDETRDEMRNDVGDGMRDGDVCAGWRAGTMRIIWCVVVCRQISLPYHSRSGSSSYIHLSMHASTHPCHHTHKI